MPRACCIWGEQWEVCDRCGFWHPLSMLMKQKGLLVCTCHGCLDDLSVERRDRVIAEKLADGREGEDLRAEKQAESDNFELEF